MATALATNPSAAARAAIGAQTDIQLALDDAIAELTALKQSSIAKERHFDCLNPDHLDALAALGTETARVNDMLFYQVADLGGLCATKEKRTRYRFVTSDLVDDNLLCEIRVRAKRLHDEPAIEMAE